MVKLDRTGLDNGLLVIVESYSSEEEANCFYQRMLNMSEIKHATLERHNSYDPVNDKTIAKIWVTYWVEL